ncbi:MAG: DUF5777 family beta-barrel protein [Saprospiraceae bacterium]|nr:DUF5777 family beta-barrel protein [Saprospiraceae bacterium]
MKQYNYKKAFTLLISMLLLSYSGNLFSQEENAEEGPDKRPVRSLFECGVLIDNATPINANKGSFELMIKHRFGFFDNKWDDLYGIYAPSNIYMGVRYGITEKLSVGFATEKNNKIQEFSLKYTILNQTRSGSSPLAISYYGNIGLDGNKKESFGANYKFANRLSYFNQIIFARKFTEKLSAQIAPSYTHYNKVDTALYNHDVLGISYGGRYKFLGDKSIILEYTVPLSVKDIPVAIGEIRPNLAFGIEIGTSTHNFQVFVANFDKIIPQANQLYNQNDFKLISNYLVGFNILIRLN